MPKVIQDELVNRKDLTKYQKYHLRHRDKRVAESKEYRIKNKDVMCAKSREYKQLHKIEIKAYQIKWEQENREKLQAYWREYNSLPKHRQRNNELAMRWYYSKVKNDPDLLLKRRLRLRIITAIKRGKFKKGGKTEELLGISFEKVKEHIESQFKEGMSWDNHSMHGWHIDHIKPISTFDLSSEEGQKRAFNYRNLQPLWAIDNLRKSDKYEIS